MKRSSLLLVLTGLSGAALGLGIGYFLGRAERHPDKVSIAAPKTPARKAQEDFVLQDGKAVSLSKLMSDYRNNPNRFKSITERSKFHIEGQVEKVGEISVLDEITGFHIPLKVSRDDVERTVSAIRGGRIGFPLPVSIYVRGLTESQIAGLNPGQVIRAECPKVRVVVGAFVFDDCTVPKDSLK